MSLCACQLLMTCIVSTWTRLSWTTTGSVCTLLCLSRLQASVSLLHDCTMQDRGQIARQQELCQSASIVRVSHAHTNSRGAACNQLIGVGCDCQCKRRLGAHPTDTQ